MICPENYESLLDLVNTEKAIKLIKDTFEQKLAENLKLMRVSAPLFVLKNSGLNDNLNGVERPVSFDAPSVSDDDIEIIHSLAKWKRMALKQYGLQRFKGIYTDMNAIRRDEKVDNLHSIYVDQWDWEKVISEEDRNIEFLQGTVERIIRALYQTQTVLLEAYPQLKPVLKDESFYCISAQQLLDRYPDLTAKQRENAIAKEYGTVMITQIGDRLSNGIPHDGRAPDYDDWALNCDILIWYDLLDCAIEISSMGIRVNRESLLSQLEKAGCMDRLNRKYHQDLVNGQLPLTMGGGIGQSRLCMLLLNKAHIGEVQSSLWPEEMIRQCLDSNIFLL